MSGWSVAFINFVVVKLTHVRNQLSEWVQVCINRKVKSKSSKLNLCCMLEYREVSREAVKLL